MANPNLKLLGGWFSPFSLRVTIALNIKSLEYENVEENILNSKSDLLLQSNPVHKKIPVLFDGDKPICESGIILEYIDEVWNSGSSILPVNAYDRAIARFWADYVDQKWLVALRGVLATEDDEAKKQYLKEMEEILVTMEDVLEKCGKGKAFIGGDHIGLIDIAFGSMLSWLSVIETMNGWKLLVEEKVPGLAKWAGRFASDPNVKGSIPETQKLLVFGKALQMKWKAAASAK